jgi:hypothetical protein
MADKHDVNLCESSSLAKVHSCPAAKFVIKFFGISKAGLKFNLAPFTSLPEGSWARVGSQLSTGNRGVSRSHSS